VLHRQCDGDSPRRSGPDERRRRLAQATAARASRHRSRGRVWIGVGVAVSAIPFAVFCVLWLNGVSLGDVLWLNGVTLSDWWRAIGTICAPVTIALVAFGRRFLAAGTETVLAEDTRAPILYLRPFDADSKEVGWSWRSRMRIAPLARIDNTYEERLARTLRKAGPFVAIGDPTEGLPQLGAARMYAADDNWQQTVRELAARASVVLMHAGESAGLAWEIHHVISLDHPKRVVLSLPLPARGKTPPRQERYDAFRRRFGDDFPQPLPDHFGDCQFIYFDADWTPRLLGRRGAPLPAGDGARAVALRRLARDFKITWAPLWVRTLVYLVAFLALAYVLGSTGL
jgi:hypothetical protein